MSAVLPRGYLPARGGAPRGSACSCCFLGGGSEAGPASVAGAVSGQPGGYCHERCAWWGSGEGRRSGGGRGSNVFWLRVGSCDHA